MTPADAHVPTAARPRAGTLPLAVAAPRAVDPGRTLAVAAYGTLLVLAVFSAVVTTVGDTAREVHSGVGGQTWALSGMSLGLATALLTLGALADEYGRRCMLLWSALLLAATSALAALAPSMGVFVGARVLQGVAGAGVLASSLGAIGHAYPSGASRTHATGIWGAAVGGGIALGPVAGAGLAAALGWRSGYWLQAAAAAALIPAAASIPESRAPVARSLDLPGVVALAAGMACLTAGLVEGRRSWISGATLVLLLAGLLLLGSFIALELRRRRPMLDLRLFRQPLFVAAITGALFTGVAVIGLMSYSPTLLQRGLGVSVLGSGAVLAAWSGTSMVVALAARALPTRVGSSTRLAIGLVLTAGGELWLTGLVAGSTWHRLLPGLIVAGVGSGIANAALGRLAVESVPRERAGMGSGASNTARYLGGAAGVALVVAIASVHGTGAGAGPALVRGWDTAALASAGLCAVGALVAALCGRRVSL
jgi:MFS family permease